MMLKYLKYPALVVSDGDAPPLSQTNLDKQQLGSMNKTLLA